MSPQIRSGFERLSPRSRRSQRHFELSEQGRTSGDVRRLGGSLRLPHAHAQLSPSSSRFRTARSPSLSLAGSHSKEALDGRPSSLPRALSHWLSRSLNLPLPISSPLPPRLSSVRTKTGNPTPAS
ncbi:hypothetical protein KFK09_021023 [Dendrobium nobile]|uniref:Uncharacterized protein n=1 Tax=Dendrobium nobile TaxID=94219 RepID=A0A8T3AP24_DENNO|nr:hypothetical protein KFK09_021023 [Dendrobium nobile]